MKHCDLASIREYAAMLKRRDMPGTAEMLDDLANEVEALRAGIRSELEDGDLENCGPRPDLWALLPDEAPT